MQSKHIPERADEAYVSHTHNDNTGDIYYYYEMHTFTSFYVRATNDVSYLSSLSPLSEAADMSKKEAKRMQKFKE